MTPIDPDPSRPLFSIHVMKTGGATLGFQFLRTFGRDAFYPGARGGGPVRKFSVEMLRDEVAGLAEPCPSTSPTRPPSWSHST